DLFGIEKTERQISIKIGDISSELAEATLYYRRGNEDVIIPAVSQGYAPPMPTYDAFHHYDSNLIEDDSDPVPMTEKIKPRR
ncbi:hypothetical protein BGX31_001730, partial [Mortierella sp. GBA43]